ncbi:MAG: hemerythrin domain-containing protein [Nocardioidaceae bacterium]
MDITELILQQHDEQRRAFALLDDVPRDDPTTLAAIWSRLEVLLEVHAEAEEKFFYPWLLKVGKGGGGADSAASETQDAIKDHNEIRDAIREVGRHKAGTKGWWQGVLHAREANSDHMAEEEREDLADFRRQADLKTRHDIAVEFIRYESEHAAGIKPTNDDPKTYVEKNS